MRGYSCCGGEYKGFTAADIRISAKNYIIVFAAECARRGGRVENVDEFFEFYGFENK